MAEDQASVLVTGGTGELGSATVTALRSAGFEARVLSRRPGVDRVLGDLATGSGLAPAARGCRAVIHAASDPTGDVRATDVDGTARLVRACRDEGVEHLVYVSIVGVDRNPLGYYRAKADAERVVARSHLPYSIVRGAQFGSLIAMLLRRATLGPVTFVPSGTAAEPLAPADFADFLVRRLADGPSGGVQELVGPERLSARAMARIWLRSAHRHGLVVPVHVPGKVVRAFRASSNIASSDALRGTTTFADWLRTH